MSVRPFSPSESFMFPKPPGSKDDNETDWLALSLPNTPAAEAGRTITPKQIGLLSTTSTAIDSNIGLTFTNPFDSVANPTAETNTEFAPVEAIRRPFVPTLDDELGVTPGDSVHVVKVFDDGWAYVEKVGSGAKGLIPVDCMRGAGENLPAFLASKRVSSFIGDGGFAIGSAV